MESFEEPRSDHMNKRGLLWTNIRDIFVKEPNTTARTRREKDLRPREMETATRMEEGEGTAIIRKHAS